jgi:hypothetical protein
MTDNYSDEDKFRCADREVKMRKRVYGRWVATGRMTREEADQQIAIMEAIAEDYRPKGLL